LHAQIADSHKCNASRSKTLAAKLGLDYEHGCSNVDLAEEFPDMLNIQNSYAANLKVLKAQDEMVGNLLNTIA